ncbi:hypothetical protein FS749_008254 [Ceratobasidium sp. UAMH 11750]|nr:hypothetical protein FS749_008254 [Ceratobasidium sp. UAMH 11750]
MSQEHPIAEQDLNNSYCPINQSDQPFIIMSTASEQGQARRTSGLSGFVVDRNAGPIQSPCQVAVYDTTGSDYPESWVEEENSLDTEVIRTDCDRDSNYVHAGWSLPAIRTQSPWILSRISNQNQARLEGSWVTKRILLRKRAISIPFEELRPALEFEADIRAALSKDGKVERFQEVYKVFNRWGDVIPLIFELGASLTVTATEKDTEKSTIYAGGCWLDQNLLVSRTGKISTKGGKLQALSGGNMITAWTSQDIQPPDWRVVRVSEVMPTVNLLNKELLYACKLYPHVTSRLTVVVGKNTGCNVTF